MNRILQKTGLYIRLSLIFLLTSIIFAQNTVSEPKPSITVSLKKQTIRENDCIPVQVWLKNENNIEINKALLNVSPPDKIKISEKPCSDKSESEFDSSAFSLDEIFTENQINTKNIRFRQIYLKSESDITVGEYNLFFNVTYWWMDENQPKQSVVSAEKSIKVNFLGSDSIAGVPLGLAGFIVPGLFFWLALNIFGVPWSENKGLGDKLIYSAIISFILIGLFTFMNYINPIKFFQSLDISNGISLYKLMQLALSGFIIGFILGISYLITVKIQKNSEAKNKISTDDADKEKIKKLLAKDPKYNPSRLRRIYWFFRESSRPNYLAGKIVKTNGKEYLGSMSERGENVTVLAGWSKIIVKKDNAALNELKELAEKKLFCQLVAKAEKNEMEIKIKNPVRVKNEDNWVDDGSEWVKVFLNKDVLEIVDDKKSNELNLEPVTVEEF